MVVRHQRGYVSDQGRLADDRSRPHPRPPGRDPPSARLRRDVSLVPSASWALVLVLTVAMIVSLRCVDLSRMRAISVGWDVSVDGTGVRGGRGNAWQGPP